MLRTIRVLILDPQSTLTVELVNRLPVRISSQGTSWMYNGTEVVFLGSGVPKGSVKEANIVFGSAALLAPILKNSTKLDWFQSTSAGIQSIIPNLPKRPLLVTKMSGFGPAMSEFVLGHIIARERHFNEFKEYQDIRRWGNDGKVTYRTMSDLTIGVLGLGNIGTSIARTLKAMGSRVVGFVGREKNDRDLTSIDSLYTGSELDIFLGQCDYVINVCPSTPETRNMLSGSVLQTCKKGSVFINVGRGDIIDDDTLIEALDKSWIEHAILDVFNHEPLPKSSVLYVHDGITISPHVSGLSTDEHSVSVFVDNLRRYIDGRPLQYQVDLSLGY